MNPVSSRARTALLAAFAALTSVAALATAGPAAAADGPSATALRGHWAPFDRCPVDDPAMLAADGRVEVAHCVASHADTGTIELGSTRVTTGASDLQFGYVQRNDGTHRLVVPAGGALVAAPAQIPGGLLGLMCPSKVPGVTAICRLLTDNGLNRVTATIEPVGAPRDFDLSAGATTGRPMVTLPVRIRLQNPFLGKKCYIGGADRPILLRPQNLTQPALGFEDFAADGTPGTNDAALTRIGLTGADQGDTTFAVPGARGCGVGGILDGAVNLKTGLPSASGGNQVTLTDAATYLAGLRGPDATAPDNGKLLSRYWHSAQQ